MPRSWKDEYASGIESIDAQHMTLFAVLDDLNAVFREGNVAEEVQRVLRFLVYYCEFHFEDEERVFREAGVEDLDAHIQEHRLFLGQVYNLLDRWHSEERTVVADLATLVRSWLNNHIVARDVPTAKAVQAWRERLVEAPSDEAPSEPK